jgi:hypothetical protein
MKKESLPTSKTQNYQTFHIVQEKFCSFQHYSIIMTSYYLEQKKQIQFNLFILCDSFDNLHTIYNLT